MNQRSTMHLEPARRSRQQGFTLIEIMIVVAIIGIIAAIALPSYQQSIRKGRRVDAKNAVLDLAAREERYFATNNVYSAVASDLGLSSFVVNASGTSYYTLSVALPTTTTYTITATPTGSQTADACYAYTLTSLGVQANTVSGGGANATADCW